MAGIILCDTTPEVTEKAGLFVIQTKSGGERIAFALTQAAIMVLAHCATEAVNALAQQRQSAVVSFRTANSQRVHKAGSQAATAGGEG